MSSVETSESEDGFTLVELLVAIALLALMATYSLGALTSLRQAERVVKQIEIKSEAEAAAFHLRQSIASARAVFANVRDEVALLSFDGSADSLEFVTVVNDELETGGLFRLRYALLPLTSSQNSELAFVVWRTLFRPANANVAQARGGEPTVLMNGVNSLAFRYYGSSTLGGVPSWTNTWPKGEGLPSLVEVTVAFGTDDARTWPPFLVVVRAAR